MTNTNDLRRILRGSFRYEFNDGVLELTGYYTGETIKLDLNCLTDDMLEELIVEDEEEDEEYEDEE